MLKTNSLPWTGDRVKIQKTFFHIQPWYTLQSRLHRFRFKFQIRKKIYVDPWDAQRPGTLEQSQIVSRFCLNIHCYTPATSSQNLTCETHQRIHGTTTTFLVTSRCATAHKTYGAVTETPIRSSHSRHNGN